MKAARRKNTAEMHRRRVEPLSVTAVNGAETPSLLNRRSTENQSGVGRTRNGSVTLADHPWGYQLTGTPADCVAFGLGGGVEIEFDFVVAGVNDGPNIGNYVVGRSGTVGACIEAAFLDVPGIAVSAYHSEDYHCTRLRTTNLIGQPGSRGNFWSDFE